MAATFMFEPGWNLIDFIDLCLSRAETWRFFIDKPPGTQNNSIQPGSDPFPFSMERQTSL